MVRERSRCLTTALQTAGYAALGECYGVGMKPSTAGWRRAALPTNRLRRGIDVDVADGTSSTSVIVEQGVNMASVVNNLTSSVKFILKRRSPSSRTSRSLSHRGPPLQLLGRRRERTEVQ